MNHTCASRKSAVSASAIRAMRYDEPIDRFECSVAAVAGMMRLRRALIDTLEAAGNLAPVVLARGIRAMGAHHLADLAVVEQSGNRLGGRVDVARRHERRAPAPLEQRCVAVDAARDDGL